MICFSLDYTKEERVFLIEMNILSLLVSNKKNNIKEKTFFISTAIHYFFKGCGPTATESVVSPPSPTNNNKNATSSLFEGFFIKI